MSTTQKKIPELRFPEFSDEWKREKLGKLCSKIGSGSTPLGGEDVYQNIGIPFIRSQNVINNNLILDDTCISKEIHSKMKGSIVKANDILLNITGGSIGRSCVVPNDFIEGNVNQHVSIIRLENDIPKFVQAFLSSYNGQKLIIREQTGSGREGLNFNSIRGFKLYLPTLPEQQKIASFLTSVDTKIEQLTKKKSLLEQYKKGVMQKLFSQEIRFKPAYESVQETEDPVVERSLNYPDWEEKRLGEVLLTYKLGGNYANSEKVSDNPLIKMGNIGRGKIIIDKIQYIASEEKIDNDDLIKYGDLFFNTRNTLELVGKVAIWRNELEKAYYNSNLMRMQFENNNFMNYRLNSYEGIKGLKRYATGTTSVAAIYTKDLLKLKIFIPCIKEQTKIANFLTTIDTKITVVAELVEATQKFKKGLLQQMFV